MNKRPGYLLLLAVFAPLFAWAQNKPELENEIVVIEKNKQIILPIEEKPLSNRQQNLKITDTATRIVTGLDDLHKPVNVLDLKPRILNYSAESEAGGKPSYLKLGVGNFLTTQLEGLYTHGNKEDYVSAKVLHFNNALGSEKWQSQGVNQLDIFGTYKALKGRLKANLLIENNRNTLYAYIPEEAERGDQRISNLRTGFDAGYAYSQANKYDLDMGVTLNAVSSYNSQKSYFGSVYGLYKQSLDDKSSFGIRPSLALNKIASTASRTVTFLDIKGDYTRTVGQLTVHPFVKLMYESDSIDKKNVHLYPGIDASYALTPRVNLYGAIYSDYSQNLFFNQVKENPWLSNISEFSYLNTPLALNVGVRANGSNFGIDVQGGLKQYKNYLVYAPFSSGSDSLKMFALNLRDTSVTLTYLSANASFRVSEEFGIETGIMLQSASSSFKASIPNVPAVTWRLAPQFHFSDFTVVPTLIIKSSYQLLTPEFKTVESGAVYDVAAKLSYSLSQRINLNADIYNLANNKPYIYYGYRQRGLLVVVGGTLKF